ncbi:MAG: hypothetical protein IJV98_02260 [Clostridia bacterium]|nr:hypothetical protein [Clostridia bacterium]
MLEHPYLAMYRRLHQEFGLKVQLNLFYRMEGFELSQVSEAYAEEWRENADWLRLSFHSDRENVSPYEHAGYREVDGDCKRVHDSILRFAGSDALADTTTIHYCLLTEQGLAAMADNGVRGLLGLFGNDNRPRTSYGLGDGDAERIRGGELLKIGNISFASIDIVLNSFKTEAILKQLAGMSERDCIRVMIHEQYFYEDYCLYQPDFEEKLRATFSFLCEHGYRSSFFGDLIS